ncbi:hypothetical protein [Streptomyces hoynatensis]|uniref:Uncharacterized protein n=1 Tax=Streptomyces hoynatensis TaxID=1141874 RepID=A0A3A9YYK0_9ACTN|nr:hypothetical protein [Streptomyces hoynatensis]RKN40784.1 hypothetical protein D7294_16990 [Streptomyces hoynatensis]
MGPSLPVRVAQTGALLMVVVPKVHPLMLLPSALIAALMLPLATVLAAAAVATWIVAGAALPLLGLLYRALIAIANYRPEVKS